MQSQRYVKMDGFEYVTPKSIVDSEEEVSCGMDIDGNEVTETIQELYDSLMGDIAYLYEFMIDRGIPQRMLVWSFPMPVAPISF